jgi:hypothetical protein
LQGFVVKTALGPVMTQIDMPDRVVERNVQALLKRRAPAA